MCMLEIQSHREIQSQPQKARFIFYMYTHPHFHLHESCLAPPTLSINWNSNTMLVDYMSVLCNDCTVTAVLMTMGTGQSVC